MVSHRPLPGLPGGEGMARETRALPGRGWPERLEPYRGGDVAAVTQGGRWRRVQTSSGRLDDPLSFWLQ